MAEQQAVDIVHKEKATIEGISDENDEQENENGNQLRPKDMNLAYTIELQTKGNESNSSSTVAVQNNQPKLTDYPIWKQCLCVFCTPCHCCEDSYCSRNAAIILWQITSAIIILGGLANPLKYAHVYTSEDKAIFWFVVQFSTIAFTGIWLLLYLIFKCDKICCGMVYVVFQILVLLAGLGWALCTCFDANSTVHIIKQQDYELFIMNNQLESDNFDIVNDYNITSEDLVVQTQLKDIEVGDWIFNVNPYTHEKFWSQIKMKIHYSWYDNGNDYYPLRMLHFNHSEGNNDDALFNSISLSDDHLIFILDNVTGEPKLVQAGHVKIGDMLYYSNFDCCSDDNYNYNDNDTDDDHDGHDTFDESLELVTVTDISQVAMCQKRVIFTTDPYLLVNNIAVSPYVGAHPIYHDILHAIFVFLANTETITSFQFTSSLVSMLFFIPLLVIYILYQWCFELVLVSFMYVAWKWVTHNQQKDY